MSINAIDLQTLIEIQLASVRNDRIADYIRKRLVGPFFTMRGWDYGSPGEGYPCWTILDDGRVGIAYCKYDFGPRCPWGLVFTGSEADRPTSFGIGSAWFPTFIEAFFEVPTAIPFPIWKILKINIEAWDVGDAVTGELEWDAAWKQCEALRDANPNSRYVVHQPLSP